MKRNVEMTLDLFIWRQSEKCVVKLQVPCREKVKPVDGVWR